MWLYPIIFDGSDGLLRILVLGVLAYPALVLETDDSLSVIAQSGA